MKNRLSAQQGFYTSLFLGLLKPDPFIKKACFRRHPWEYEKLHLFSEELIILFVGFSEGERTISARSQDYPYSRVPINICFDQFYIHFYLT